MKPDQGNQSTGNRGTGKRLATSKDAGGRVLIGRHPDAKRLEALDTKKVKTAVEINEEILLRLKRIEDCLGIK